MITPTLGLFLHSSRTGPVRSIVSKTPLALALGKGASINVPTLSHDRSANRKGAITFIERTTLLNSVSMTNLLKEGRKNRNG